MAEEMIHAVGKRKTAVARVWMKPGNGQLIINKRPMEKYFTRVSEQTVVMEPLRLTETANKFDLYVNVRGGGITGQAGAVRHGISKALVEAVPELRDSLKREGYLTRDSRMKERKKYGQPGARKRFQYSKR